MHVALAVLFACAFVALNRPYVKRWTRRLALLFQTLLALMVLHAGVSIAYSLVRHERVVPKWDRTRDPNVLNNHARFGQMNEAIVVPHSAQGEVLTRSESQDVHIEVDRRGVRGVCSVPLTMAQFAGILEESAKRGTEQRFLLWIDGRCEAEHRDAVLRLLREQGHDSVYFVVHEGNYWDMNIVYKGIAIHFVAREGGCRDMNIVYKGIYHDKVIRGQE